MTFDRSAEPLARPSGPLRVAITHPVRVWVDTLERALAPRTDIDVVAAHTDPRWVRPAIATREADLLLLCVVPPADGLPELLSDLLGVHPGLCVVGLGDIEDPALLMGMIRAGGRGWLASTSTIDELVRALHDVSDGGAWFPPMLLGQILEGFLRVQRAQDEAGGRLSLLSDRELQILECLAHGMTRTEIAEQFFLSPHTVRTHINNLLHKLDVHSTLAAVALVRDAMSHR